MKLYVRDINYQLIVKILFLCFINFNTVFGCISRKPFNDEIRNSKNNLEYQNFKTTLSTISGNIEGNEPQIMTEFQTFLANKYDWRIELEELNFLWDKFKEFSIQNGLINKTWIKRKTKKYYKHSNATFTVMLEENINRSLENEDKKIKISQASNVRRSSSHQDLVKNREEKHKALLAGKTFTEQACSIKKDLFCVRKFLKENQSQPLFQVVPKALFIKRCANECNCLQRTDACLPKSIVNRTEYVFAKMLVNHHLLQHSENKSQTSRFVDVIFTLNLVDHVDCECRDRCANRRCISNFEKVASLNSCSCQCIRNEKLCQKILKGNRKISDEDYRCILSGECIPPDCVGGNLTEERLYFKKCPAVEISNFGINKK